MRESRNALARTVWRMLGAADKFFLAKYDMIICLDKAMQNLVLERCPSAKTCVIPTWRLQKTEHFNLGKKGPFETLRLLYSGNLGTGHSLEAYGELLKILRLKLDKVEISYCGNSAAAIEKFSKLAESCGVSFRHYRRVENYGDMGKLYKENGIHYGVTLLNDSLNGVVSPSKFNGYISFGLPLLYLGPKFTNAWDVCENLGAGLAWSSGDDMEKTAEKLCDSQIQRQCAAATSAANLRFTAALAGDVAEELLKALPRK
jgi:hypothetical protein